MPTYDEIDLYDDFLIISNITKNIIIKLNIIQTIVYLLSELIEYEIGILNSNDAVRLCDP